MNRNKNNVKVTLTGFRFVEDGQIPEDFEVCLLILEDGKLSAACWDTGLYSREVDPRGCFRQSRGGVIAPDDVWAWLPIEEESIDLEAVDNADYGI